MAITTGTMVNNIYANANEAVKGNTAEKTKKKSEYGKTIGDPKLSDKAKKYYDSLKKKYNNYDFILVSEEEKENAKANASKYANKAKTVVLINEEKIERMASDEKYRNQYEGLLSGATNQLAQLKSRMETTAANVKGYGMQVNDNGTASFFAILKKSSSDQKTRIEKNAEKKHAEKKAAEKKAAKKADEERLRNKKSEKTDNEEFDEYDDFDYEDTVTISANSIEELITKINEFTMTNRSDSVLTNEEKLVGQNIDFKG